MLNHNSEPSNLNQTSKALNLNHTSKALILNKKIKVLLLKITYYLENPQFFKLRQNIFVFYYYILKIKCLYTVEFLLFNTVVIFINFKIITSNYNGYLLVVNMLLFSYFIFKIDIAASALQEYLRRNPESAFYKYLEEQEKERHKEIFGHDKHQSKAPKEPVDDYNDPKK